MRRAHGGHEYDRDDDVERVAPRVTKQTEPFSHACTRTRASAAVTCLSVIVRIPPELVRISEGVRHGPQMRGSEEPKSTTTGMPNAAAMWAGPESLPRNTEAPAMSDLISTSGAP